MKNLKTFETFSINETKTYKVTDIIYDGDDGDDIEDLPKTLNIDIPNDLKDDYEISEYISDKISDITGFCHKGFSTTPKLKM